MSDFIKAIAASEVKEGGIRQVECDGKPLAIAKLGGKFHAIDNTCPHRGGPLGEGAVGGNIVTCPWHGWRYDITTGACVNNPAAHVNCYEVKVEKDDVLVKL